MEPIPLHQLQEITATGLRLAHISAGDAQEDNIAALGAHRDDHYLFFVLEKGFGSMMIEFQEVEIPAPALYYVLPTQIHRRLRNEQADGWFVALDTAFVPRECRDVFEGQLVLQAPFRCTTEQLRQFCDLLWLLREQREQAEKPFQAPVIQGLVQAFVGLAAGCYDERRGGVVKQARLATLASEFKKLLAAQLRTTKSPAAYAAHLNVSESYLNEALRKTTGFPVRYWIQQEVALEAKRLLYYSELNVKEIAHELGYADHSYFSRFFRKAVGVSALAFREQYRK